MTQPASEQMTYAEAMALATAAYAAARAAQVVAPMEALAATIRAAAAATNRVQESAVVSVRQLWQRTNPYSDAEVDRFATAAGRMLVSAQRSIAQVTAAAQTRAFETVGARGVTVSASIPDDVRGTRSRSAVVVDAEQGRTVRRSRAIVHYADAERTVSAEDSRTSRVMVRVAGEYRYSRSQGRTHAEALTAADNRIRVIVDGNLQVARTLVEEGALQSLRRAFEEGTVDLDQEPIGYRRVIHPERSVGGVCGLCVVAADRTYKIGELKAIHSLCKCTVLPIFEDSDPGQELNGEDLDALYKAAGGNTRDRFKRTRYKLIDHSELGPLLVPQKKGQAVPYFRGPDDVPGEAEEAQTPAEALASA
ncbi:MULTISPECIES: hypothetical protein [Nocardia]|uniref:hypothetical protein n=1 Tax=Nocardia TaxID=1817 RepID=UPI002454205E|nr:MULTISPECIES: hypothetical protein [Nocardia]